MSADVAAAQLAGFVSLDSQARNRGYSVSAGDPVITGGLSFDHASGAYANATMTRVFAGSGLQLLTGQWNAGYAWRAGDLSLDVGAVRTDYSRYSARQRSAHYSEGYFGIAKGSSSARLSISPDYFRADTPTLYLEAERVFEPAPDWSIAVHGGSLVYLGSRSAFAHSVNYDWRIGVSRRWGAFNLHAALSGGGPGDDFYRGETRDRTAFLFGAAMAF